jgi:hypothetical protein
LRFLEVAFGLVEALLRGFIVDLCFKLGAKVRGGNDVNCVRANMNLDEAQKQTVTSWIEQGLKLSEIQNKLASDLGVKLTYMEVRFLIDDLKLKLKEPELPKPVAPEKSAAENAEADLLPEEPEHGPGGGVSVTVDHLTRPGALVSGKVTFSDGNIADWYLDQNGRLGIAPKTQGYRPPQEDVLAFQTQLQNELAKLGM